MRKLSWLSVLVLSMVSVGCSDDSPAGAEPNGSPLSSGGSSGAAGSNAAGSNAAGNNAAGSNAGTCAVSDIGKPCATEGGTCKTGLKCNPTELHCVGGVWTDKEPPCGAGGAGGAGGGGQAGSGQAGAGGSASCCQPSTCGDEQRCVEGSCFDMKPGDCFTDADCGGKQCVGATVCACGLVCAAGTNPGRCEEFACTSPNTPVKVCVDGKITDDCYGPTQGAPPPFADCGGGACVPEGQTCGDKVCGGFAGVACAADEFCKFAPQDMCGAADQTGVCTQKPASCAPGCPAPEFQLCACDGNKYCNECEASKAGTSVIPCSPTGCTSPNTPVKVCSGGQIADACYGPNDGAPPPFVDCGGGACVPEGQTCGKVCGGKTGAQCADDEFCNFPPAAACGTFDSTGLCAKKPLSCDAVCGFVPTCGCDGSDYCNECEANAKGVSATSYEYCHPGPKACGGFAGATCAADEFCDFADADLCGFADAQGVCKKKPASCAPGCPAPEFWVCACDGNKYCNECEANAQGADVTPCSKGNDGDPCAADSECGSGLKCCYPCGIPGCSNKCMAPGPDGQCPAFP